MSAVGDPQEPDDLPERIIVVRESIDADPEVAAAELDALASEIASREAATDEDRIPTIDIDAPSDPDELQAELDALAAEVGAEPLDLDSLSFRAPRSQADAEPEPEPEPLEPEPLDDAESLGRLLGRDDIVEDPRPPPEPFRWPEDDDDASLHWAPERDETGPGTLRPKVPEPVIAARTSSSPSLARRTVSRLRALIGLVVVVVLAGVGLAGAIGGAVLLVVLVLSRAFGSDG